MIKTEPLSYLPEPVRREIMDDEIDKVIINTKVTVTTKSGDLIEFCYETGRGWLQRRLT